MKQHSSEYQIIIEGQLDSEWEEWFSPLTITPRANGTTLLHGLLKDQAALFGMLNKLYKLNLELVSLKKVEGSVFLDERE
jgi:hypothetical protein